MAFIYTYNNTNKHAWVTISDLGKTQHLDYGWLPSGTIRGWQGSDYAWGSFYHVRMEVKDPASIGNEPNTIYDTSIQINPQSSKLAVALVFGIAQTLISVSDPFAVAVSVAQLATSLSTDSIEGKNNVVTLQQGDNNYYLENSLEPLSVMQDKWYLCHKCLGLFYGSGPGICPADYGHTMEFSNNYKLALQGDDEGNWLFCNKCNGLYFSGSTAGVCPEGGQHAGSGSANYRLSTYGFGQDGWYRCDKCQGLCYTGTRGTGKTKCPATKGEHNVQKNVNYVLRTNDKDEAGNIVFVTAELEGDLLHGALGYGLLFYDSTTGEAQVYNAKKDGSCRTLGPLIRNWRQGWQIIAGKFSDRVLSGLLFYQSSTGEAQFYDADGNGGIQSLGSLYTGWRQGWQIIAGKFSDSGYTSLLFYQPSTGEAQFYNTDGNGGIQSLGSLYTGWRQGWQIIAGKFSDSGYTSLLFYQPSTGEAQFYNTDGNGGIQSLGSLYTGWRQGWQIIRWQVRPYGFTDSDHTSLLFYQPSTGEAQFYNTDGNGGIQALGSLHTGWRQSWQIIPGRYFSSGASQYADVPPFY